MESYVLDPFNLMLTSASSMLSLKLIFSEMTMQLLARSLVGSLIIEFLTSLAVSYAPLSHMMA